MSSRFGKKIRSFAAVKTVLFDLDGTLIDSADAYYESMRQTCEKLQLRVPDKLTILAAMNAGEDGFKYILSEEQYRQREVWVRRFFQEHETVWMRIFSKMARCLPGVARSVKQLKAQGYRLGIVTSSPREAVYPLSEKNLMPLFATVVSRSDGSKRKPHPEPVLLALEKIGSEPHAAVIVGDTPMDVLAGRAAGVRTIGVLTGGQTETLLKEADPELIFADVPAAARFLTHISSPRHTVIAGEAVRGEGQAAGFMQLPWVKEQIRQRLGFEPFPGTLNIRLNNEQSRIYREFIREYGKSANALTIVPQPGFCQAYCIPATVKRDGEDLCGGVLFPQVNDYPADKIELISSFSFRKVGVAEGDSFNITLHHSA